MNITLAQRFIQGMRQVADWAPVAVAVTLPWSTSATVFFIFVWLFACVPSLNWSAARFALKRPAVYLPVGLVALAAIGMLWADVTWKERAAGLYPYLRLMAIPLLIVQFQRAETGKLVLVGFLASSVALLLASWSVWLFDLPSFGRVGGLPVKDATGQSSIFLVAIACLAYVALDLIEGRRHALAAACVIIAVACAVNMTSVAASRTALLTLPILILILGYSRYRWKGAAIALMVAAVAVAAAWQSSSYFRFRVGVIPHEISEYRPDGVRSSTGERLEFWRKAAGFVTEAPVIGHGTGSIRTLYANAAGGRTGVEGVATVNPHNQSFAVAIDLGIIGVAVLWAMWLAHITIFMRPGIAAWIGTAVTIQCVIGSIFNSSLFDFLQSWIYIFGAGICGGLLLRSLSLGAGKSHQKPANQQTANTQSA